MPQQTDRTIYVGSVGKEVDEPALLALFGHCGTVSHSGLLLAEFQRSRFLNGQHPSLHPPLPLGDSNQDSRGSLI